MTNAIEDTDVDILEGRIRSLGMHQRLLFRIIDQAGKIDSETLHAR